MTRQDVLRRAPQVAALVVVLGALAYCALFRVTGGHWERVETPSMGTTAPVGTLLWLRPVDTDDLEVGGIISFREPGIANGPVFSHRIAEVHDDGTISTAGDLSGRDGWLVQPSDVKGQVVHVWKGVGWLVLAAPVLVIGGLVTAGLVLVVRSRAKLPLGLIGASITLAVVMVVYQPLAGAQFLGIDQGNDVTTAKYVSTGLLPVRLSADGHSSPDMGPGETGTLEMADHGGRLDVHVASHVPLWFWLLLLAGCFTPALGSAAIGRVEEPEGKRRREEPVAV